MIANSFTLQSGSALSILNLEKFSSAIQHETLAFLLVDALFYCVSGRRIILQHQILRWIPPASPSTYAWRDCTDKLSTIPQYSGAIMPPSASLSKPATMGKRVPRVDVQISNSREATPTALKPASKTMAKGDAEVSLRRIASVLVSHANHLCSLLQSSNPTLRTYETW